jgi:Polysaccharide pyruvyl transferase
MKIAVMTQPLGANYGGIMQAWALQQVLKQMGHEPVTIDRQADPKSSTYRATQLAYRILKKVIGKRKAPVFIEHHLPTIQQHTRAFINQYITMSEPIDTTEKLKRHFECEQYDAVIVGSDQTWRASYSPKIENFFLDFLEGSRIKRIAYATSFGVDEWEFNKAHTINFRHLAKMFDAIGVREDTGIELCRKYLDVDATHVLDPTLLLDKLDYEQLLGPEMLNREKKGVYTYFLNSTLEKEQRALQIGRELGETVFSCQAKVGLDINTNGCLSDYIMPEIKEWLAGFANSRLVLTDSFHGMVFATIFEKKFQVYVNSARGASRFNSLANLICSEKAGNNLKSETIILNNPSNYQLSKSNLLRKKQASWSFLSSILQTEYPVLRQP